MKKTLIYILTILFGLIVCSSWTTQSTNKNLSFIDVYGNNIIINNIDSLPSNLLDSSFFKSNFTGLLFNKKLLMKSYRYDYIISEFKSTKKKNKFEFLLNIYPHSKDTEEVLKYMNSHIHCSFTIKKINGLIQLDSLELINSEI